MSAQPAGKPGEPGDGGKILTNSPQVRALSDLRGGASGAHFRGRDWTFLPYWVALPGVYCELRGQACKQIFVRELEALLRITHVGYYEAIAARPRVLTKACWARDCCEST